MPYDLGMIDRLLYVRWRSTPTARELADILTEAESRQRLAGGPLVYLTIVPANTPVPDQEQRAALDAFASRLRPLVTRAFIVLEGSGFRASIQRSVVIGFTWFKKESSITRIVSTVDEAIRRIAAEETGFTATALADEARRRGLLA